MTDRQLLYAAAFLRATSTGLVGVLLGLYLARLGLSGAAIGLVISAGLAGATVAAIAATCCGDRLGRRRFLALTAVLGGAGAAGAALAGQPLALAICAFAGMLNGMGRDRSAALILEQAALPATTTAAGRTRVIAGYTMLQDLGHALGALLAGLPALVERATGWSGVQPHRAALLGVAALSLVALSLYGRLSAAVESAGPRARPRISRRSRSILARISALFALDGLAGGFLTTALLSYFFFQRFGAAEGTVGVLFFAARLLNAFSHLGAAWLARRIGLVRTMVYTHVPSSLLLLTVAFAPNFPVAALLFLLREGLVEMDVPARQSYVLALVAPEERVFALGVTNLVRLAAWAIAPACAGMLMTGQRLYPPLVIGATLKIAYDLLLWAEFRSLRPPEEQPVA